MSRKSKQHLDSAFLDLVRTMFHYDQETGDLLWAVDLGAEALSGQVATRTRVDPKGYRSVVVDVEHKTYVASRLIWFMVTGHWPKHIIAHLNGDTLDNRLGNLSDMTRKRQSKTLRVKRAPVS